ncbi:MAG: FAD-dependent oxidoreductase [Planctomycetota bacterium]|nr:FAD-dependent oxidoreductase [Planctomycetota bacterium]
MSEQPRSANIVIIGGGAVGCGVAYSLAKAGLEDVVLLEKEPTLAAATSGQAAGLVGQVRNSVERTRLAMWSVETFSELQADEIADPGWRQVGSLRVALNAERVQEFEQMKAVADEAGLATEFIDPVAAGDCWPLMDFSAAEAVLWCPSDGYLQPSDLTMAYAAHARRMGVQFLTDMPARAIHLDAGRVVSVETAGGSIACETVINAAGAHAFHLAQSVGLELPIVPVRHEFFVTVHADGLEPGLPVVRIPDAALYLRAETNALLCGGWEPEGMSNDPRGFELRAELPAIEPDYEVLSWFAEQLAPHLPKVNELGLRSVFRGWPTFTPDGRFIIGPSARVPGLVMAGGCNAHGVSGSAGIGRHVVESMLEDTPSEYVRSLSPNRFSENDWSWEVARREAQHVYETYYCLGH